MAIPEESTAWLTVTFKDRNGNKDKPNKVFYRIDTALGTTIATGSGAGSFIELSASQVSASVELELKPDYNKIIEKTSRGFQENIVTIKATFGGSGTDQRIEEFNYNIEDLKNI